MKSPITFVTIFALGCTQQPPRPDPVDPGGGKGDSGTSETRTMIGRCSYDTGPGSATGAFRVGSAVANFYRVTGSGAPHFVVAHGIAVVPGTIAGKLDTIDILDRGPTALDQGTLWPTYDLVFEMTGSIIYGEWIDAITRELVPEDPPPSEVGYQVVTLGTVRAGTARGIGSALQTFVVGRPTAYPYCVFWELP